MDKQPDVQVRTTGEFKLRKDPMSRRYQFIHLEKMFGFIPEVIVVELGSGNNKFKVSAIIPEKVLAEMQKEEEKIKEKLDAVEKASVPGDEIIVPAKLAEKIKDTQEKLRET